MGYRFKAWRLGEFIVTAPTAKSALRVLQEHLLPQGEVAIEAIFEAGHEFSRLPDEAFRMCTDVGPSRRPSTATVRYEDGEVVWVEATPHEWGLCNCKTVLRDWPGRPRPASGDER